MFGNNSILRSWFLQFTVTVILITSMNVSALPPSWWQQPDSAGRRVVYPSVINSNNFAPANIGQAKFMARRAIETLRMYAPTVANNIEADLVGPGNIIPSWDAPAPGSEMAKQQYAPLQIGQLKAIADPFYTRLNTYNSTWLNGQLVANLTKDPADNTNFFPWTNATGDDKNKAIATIGQLKAVFALHFEQLEVTDPDENTGNMARLSVVDKMKVRVTEPDPDNDKKGRMKAKPGVKLQFTRLSGNGSFAGGVVQKTYTTNSAGEVSILNDYTSYEGDLIRVSMLTSQGRQNVWLPANVSPPEAIARTGSGGHDYQPPGGFVGLGEEPEVDDNPDPPGSPESVKRLTSYIKYDATWVETIGGTNAQVTTREIDWNPVLGSSNGIGAIDDDTGEAVEVPGRVVTTTIDYENEELTDFVDGPKVVHDVTSETGEAYEINGYTQISDTTSAKAVATMNISATRLPEGVGRFEMEHAYLWLDAVGNKGIKDRKTLVLGTADKEIVTSTGEVGIGNGSVTSVLGPFLSKGIGNSGGGRSTSLTWSEVEKNEVRFNVDDMQCLRVEVMTDVTPCSSALSTYGWKVESDNPEINVSIRSYNGVEWVGQEVPDFFYDDLVGSFARTNVEIRIKCAEGAVNSKGMIKVAFVNADLDVIVQKEFKVVITDGPFSDEDDPTYNEGSLTKTITNNESSGPKYRKIALDGRPLADEKPQGAEETDESDEETYVDALTRELRHSTTDIYVPVPGSDLALTVKRSIVSEIWNPTSGLCPHEDPTLAFGPVWRTNLAANVNIIEQFEKTGAPEGEVGSSTGIENLVAGMDNEEREGMSARQRDPNYAFVTDEDGNSHRFMIAYNSPGGRAFVPAPTDKNEAAASEVSLTFGGPGLIFSKLHGNTLEFGPCIDFTLPSVRMAGIGPDNGTTDGGTLTETDSEWGGGVSSLQNNAGSTVGTAGGGQVQKYNYYRLLSVTDRFGTKLVYEYDGNEDVVPKSIKVHGRPELAIHVNTVDGKIRSVSDPMGNQTFYEYHTLGNGTLTKVVADGVAIRKYGYKRWEETDYRKNVTSGAGEGSGGGNANLLPWANLVSSNPLEEPGGLFQYGEKVQHFDLASISDAEDNTYTFLTVVDTSHTTMSVSNFAVPSGGASVSLGSYLQNGSLENGGPCVRRYPLAGFPPDVYRISLPGGGTVEIGGADTLPPVGGSQIQSVPLGNRHTVVRDAEGNRRTYVWDKAITVAVDQQMMGYTQEVAVGAVPSSLADSVLDIDDLENEQPPALPSPTGSTTIHTYYTRMSISHDKGGRETYVFNFLASGALASVTDFSGNVTKYGYGPHPNHPDPAGTAVITSLPPGGITPPLLSKPTSEIIPAVNGLEEPDRTTWFSYGYQGMMSKRFDRNGLTRDFGLKDLPEPARKMGRSMRETVLSGSTVLGETAIAYHSNTKGTGFPGFPIKRTVKETGHFTSSDPSWVQDLVTLYEPDSFGRVAREASDMNASGTFDDPDLITRYTYDRNGNKLTVTDPVGMTTWFHYDKRNRLTSVVHPDGTTKEIVYNKRGKKVLERDENGVATGFVYNSRGRLTKTIRDMNGNLSHSVSGLVGIDAGVDIITEKVYDKIGSVIQTKDARGYITVSKYDHLRRLIKSIVPDSSRLPGQVPTEAADDVTTYGYGPVQGSLFGVNSGASCFDSSGFKPTKITDPRGYTSYFVYDPLYRCVESRTQYSFSPDEYAAKFNYYNDITGVLRRVDTPRGPVGADGGPLDPTIEGGLRVTNTFDELFRPKTVVENSLDNTLPGASELTTYYTSTGLAWKTKRKLSAGVFAETTTEYDAAGRSTKVTMPPVPVVGVSSPVTPEISNQYSLSGLVIQSKDQNGKVTHFIHDARGRKIQQVSPEVPDYSGPAFSPVSTVTYDKVGNVVKTTDPLGNSSVTEYDAANRAVKVISPSYVDNQTSLQVTPVTQSFYDQGGNPVKVIDPNGSVSINTYDARGNLVQTKTNPLVPASSSATHAEDMLTTFAWDKVGNRTRVVDAAGQHTSFEYDGLNRLTATIWDSNDVSRKKTESSIYDALVQTSRTDARGYTTSLHYADRLLLTGTTSDDIPEDNETRTYDSAGRLLTASSARNTRLNVSYVYDKLDRLSQETSAGYTHEYGYDRAGNRTRVYYQHTARTLTSVYDNLNRLTSIEESKTGVPSTRVTSYKYDAAGNVRERRQANNTKETNVYDAIGRRVSQKTTTSSGVPISLFEYDYDPAGNLVRIDEDYSSTTVPDRTVHNTYDRQSRLLTETADTLTSGGVVSKSVLTSYGYSKANNRSSKTVQLTEGGSVVSTSSESYTYGDSSNGKNSNQLHSLVKGGDTTVYTYDGNGNRQQKFINGLLAETYSWDSYDRLLTIAQSSPAKSYSYGYDHRSRRVIRDESDAAGDETIVSFSGGTSVFEAKVPTTSPYNPVTTVEFIRGSDYGGGVGGIMYSVRGGSNLFNAYNSRGDVVAQTNSGGTVTWQAAYEAFGTSEEEGENLDRQRANTKEEDPTGLLNEGFRYRDLETGTFISRDPLGFVDGPNVYTYVMQNPWTSFDPLGLATSIQDDGTASVSTEDPEREEEEEEEEEETITVLPYESMRDLQQLAEADAEMKAIPKVEVPFEFTSEWTFRLWAMNATPAELDAAADNPAYSESLRREFRARSQFVSEANHDWSILAGTAEGVDWILAMVEPTPFGEMLMGGRTMVNAADDLAGAALRVNPTRSMNNCANCTIAMDSTLAGSPASAMPLLRASDIRLGGTPLSVLEKTFKGTFKPVADQAGVESILASAGSGARGIVYGKNPSNNVGHVWNAVNQKGSIRFLDAQSGATGARAADNFNNYQVFKFLRTN